MANLKLILAFNIAHFLLCIRRLVLCCVCVLFLVQPTITQEEDRPCTALELRCPNYIVSGRAPITFSADMLGAKQILGEQGAKRLSYRWEVSGGKIIDGQGTQKIVVEPTDMKEGGVTNMNVTVEVKGVSPECENKKSCSLKVNPTCTAPDRYTTYGGFAFKDEKCRLDDVANSIINSASNSIIYILAYAGRQACIGEAEWRANRVKNYLVEQHKIPSHRIIVVNAGFRKELAIDIFISPTGSCGPLPSPTLTANEVQIEGQCSDKYKELTTTAR